MNHSSHSQNNLSLNQSAFSATIHCLTGCAIGEILGMVLGSALGWDNMHTAGVSVVLAFIFGYSLTLSPILKSGVPLAAAIALTLASDTLSIAVMEVVDNAIMLVVPGAMDAGLSTPLFWGTMLVSLVFAGAAAFPLNRWLIARGKGHAVVHAFHESNAPQRSVRPCCQEEHAHHG